MMKKTPKLITKRICLKRKTKKAIHKSSNVSHYNSNDTGNERRNKRRPASLDKKTAKKLILLVH